MTTEEKIEFFGKIVALLVFAFSVLTYAYGVFERNRFEKLRNSSELIDRYYLNDSKNSSISSMENEIRNYLLYYTSVWDLNDSEKVPENVFVPIARETFFGKAQNGGGARQGALLDQYRSILSFFERVKVCMESNQCDSDSLGQFFCLKREGFFYENRRLLEYLGEIDSTIKPLVSENVLSKKCLEL